MSTDPKIKKMFELNEQAKQIEQLRYRSLFLTTPSQPITPPMTPMVQTSMEQTPKDDNEIEMENTNAFPSRWFR